MEALNHASIIEAVVKKFPSPKCKSRVVDFKRFSANQGKSQLQLLREFMLAKRSQQRDLMKLLDPEKKSNGKCFNCLEPGHLSKNCPKNKSKNYKSVNACVYR